VPASAAPGAPGTLPPSGQQIELAAGGQRATIVEVGGGVRAYQVGDRPVLQPYPADAMCDAAHGAPLIPWPNRLADGRYRFDGSTYQVALTEPDKRNAIHGLLRWRSWRPGGRQADRVTMTTRLHPMAGYPFLLDVAVEYQLGPDGLTVRTSATNLGRTACPFGAGQHPYLSPGEALIDDCTLTAPGATRIVTDAERQLPAGREPVDGTPYDFRAGRRLGDLPVDFAFTDLERDSGGLAWVRLVAPDGRTAELWLDEGYRFVELFTGDGLAPGRRRRGLGAEPMSCAPNAFASGDGLVRLEPGETWTAAWGVRLTGQRR
jgi:aldose 1-epimerase